jgi:NTE family protein
MIISKKIVLFCFILFSTVYSQTTDTISFQTRTANLPFGLKSRIPIIQPEVALALSGGGARGFAQIGILRALIQNGIPINLIVGTSIGSLTGGLYAAGYSINQLDSIAVNTDWDDLLSSDRETSRKDLFIDQKVTQDRAVLTLRLQNFKLILPTSINNGQRLTNYFNLLTFQAPIHVKTSFDDLSIKFRAVCTNLVTGTPVILKSGSLSQAMRASSSVSFLLPPVRIDSLTLVDGGLVANVPVKIAKSNHPDYVIAVNTTSDLHTKRELSLPWYVADQIVSIPMKVINENQLELADMVIKPGLDSLYASDFSEAKPIIKDGYNSTIQLIKNIKASLDSITWKKFNKKKYYIRNVMLPSSYPDYEAPFIAKYTTEDSVSNYEILLDILSLYKKGDFKNIKAVIKQHSNYSTVEFAAEENPTIKSIVFNNITLLDTSIIYSDSHSLLNRPYNPKRLENMLLNLLNRYRENGYSLAEISDITFNKDTSSIDINFDEGRIDSIQVEGNKYTYTSVITRELPFKTGDYFVYNDIKQGLINLRATNLFDNVFMTFRKEDGKNILSINVEEKASSLLRLGFRVDETNKTQASLDLRDENLFGTGAELGMLLIGGIRDRGIFLEQKSNRIFDTYLTYKISAYYRFQDITTYENAPTTSAYRFSRQESGEYREIYYGASLGLGTQVEKFGDLIFEGKYQIDQVKNKINQQVSPYKLKTISLRISSTIDTQNKYPYPTKGFYFKGFYETAQSVLGADLGYSDIGFRYKNYLTIGTSNTISPRVEMGFADKTLPLSEEYSLGGQNSFFGMHQDEYFGRQIFLTSLEYRYKLPFQIFFDTYFKLRYDLGSIWAVQNQIRFKDLRHGIGGTISFDTPIGPAEFSVGRSFQFIKNLPGNPVSWGDTLFYFSIGYYLPYSESAE